MKKKIFREKKTAVEKPIETPKKAVKTTSKKVIDND